jgi:peptidyl-prolyl cis-trans isomerase SurA
VALDLVAVTLSIQEPAGAINMNPMMRLRPLLFALLCIPLCLPDLAKSQSAVSAVLRVNQSVITQYELDQRIRFLQVIQTSGDLRQAARDQLIDDRLKNSLAAGMNLKLSDGKLEQSMTEFAASGNLSLEDFVTILSQAGVDRQSYADFIKSNLIWGMLIQQLFAPRVQITEAEVDRAYQARLEGSAMRVLLSELIMPISEDTYEQVTARAQLFAKLTSLNEFADAAERYSVAETRDIGGRLDWTEVNKLPPTLQSLIVSLTPGQVTEPIPLDGGVALFQLRDIEETSYRTPLIAVVDYMTYRILTETPEETLQQAKQVAALTDTCDDLYGIAKGQPEDRLQRHSKAPADIPARLSLQLAKLDENEMMLAAPDPNDGSVLLVMLCGRLAETIEDLSRQDVMRGLQMQRLSSYADQYLQSLRSSAYIAEQ